MEVKLSFDDATVALIKNLTAAFEGLNENAAAIVEGETETKKPAKKKETAAKKKETAAAKKKREAAEKKAEEEAADDAGATEEQITAIKDACAAAVKSGVDKKAVLAIMEGNYGAKRVTDLKACDVDAFIAEIVAAAGAAAPDDDDSGL